MDSYLKRNRTLEEEKNFWKQNHDKLLRDLNLAKESLRTAEESLKKREEDFRYLMEEKNYFFNNKFQKN